MAATKYEFAYETAIESGSVLVLPRDGETPEQAFIRWCEDRYFGMEGTLEGFVIPSHWLVGSLKVS